MNRPKTKPKSKPNAANPETQKMAAPSAQPDSEAPLPNVNVEAQARTIWRPASPNAKVVERLPEAVAELQARLQKIVAEHQQPVMSVSLVVEDMVLLDAIHRGGLRVRTFTLNTGKLPAESLAILTRAQSTYSSLIEEVHPAQPDLVHFFGQYTDFDDIYKSHEARLACCAMRIVKPLERALKGADAWITGRWRGQGVTRNALELSEIDAARQLTKYNPLFDWDEALIWAYAQFYGVPINELHLCGFPSIGCEPCTRAVYQGDRYRSGRWWWEKPEDKETGLHHSIEN